MIILYPVTWTNTYYIMPHNAKNTYNLHWRKQQAIWFPPNAIKLAFGADCYINCYPFTVLFGMSYCWVYHGLPHGAFRKCYPQMVWFIMDKQKPTLTIYKLINGWFGVIPMTFFGKPHIRRGTACVTAPCARTKASSQWCRGAVVVSEGSP
jgi:hypothetical protein